MALLFLRMCGGSSRLDLDTRELWGKLLFPFKDVAPSLNSAVLGAPEGTSFVFEISIFTSIL